MSWLSRILNLFTGRDPLARAGELAIAEAERLWSLDVYDPSKFDKTARANRSREVINDILIAAGWHWATPYMGNGPPQWCGLFAAKCWRVAGIDPRWLATFWASTLRLASWVRYRKWNSTSAGVKPELGGRMFMRGTDAAFPDGSQPRAGDVVIVGNGTPAEGDHITLLVSREGDVWHTISGNGGGLGPDGRRREGIVKTDYRVDGKGYRVLWVMRPGLADLA